MGRKVAPTTTTIAAARNFVDVFVLHRGVDSNLVLIVVIVVVITIAVGQVYVQVGDIDRSALSNKNGKGEEYSHY